MWDRAEATVLGVTTCLHDWKSLPNKTAHFSHTWIVQEDYRTSFIYLWMPEVFIWLDDSVCEANVNEAHIHVQSMLLKHKVQKNKNQVMQARWYTLQLSGSILCSFFQLFCYVISCMWKRSFILQHSLSMPPSHQLAKSLSWNNRIPG